MAAQSKGPNARNAGAPKKSSKPIPKCSMESAHALDLALRDATGLSLLDFHASLLAAWQTGVAALELAQFIAGDSDASCLRSRYPWVKAWAQKAVAEMEAIDHHTERLLAAVEPLVKFLAVNRNEGKQK